MESAPASIPLTIAGTFSSGLATPGTLIFRCLPVSSPSPHRAASATAGTNPPADTRFGSSKRAEILELT